MYWDCKCGAKVPSYEGSICSECREAAKVVVATIEVAEAFEMNRPAESASAYHYVKVEPGTYPVELRMTGKGERYLIAKFEGTVTSAGYRSKSYPEKVGTKDVLGLSPYKYQLRGGKYFGKVTVTNPEALETARGV